MDGKPRTTGGGEIPAAGYTSTGPGRTSVAAALEAVSKMPQEDDEAAKVQEAKEV